MKIDVLSVSIVMPCLNESATLGACVAQAQEALRQIEARFGLTGEVLVADNGSTDGSQEIARNSGARVVDVPSKGYGAALQGGFNAARGKYLVMGDSDMSYDFTEVVEMIAELEGGADLCMGSRFLGKIEDGAMPWKNRYIGNPALSAILRMLTGTQVNDAHCGLRALTRKTFQKMNLTSTGMEFASEMVMKAAIMKLKIAEVPVTLSPDGRGRPPHLNPWRDGFRHLFFMLMLCPAWLFMAPAACLFIGGFTILSALLISGVEMVPIAGFVFGDHWAVVASAFLTLSVQLACLGLIALAQAYRENLREPTGAVGRFLERSALFHWLVGGLGLMLLGLCWATAITVGWVGSDFGSLNAIRDLIAAFTAVVIGVQLVFTGFLLSIVSGNRLHHAPQSLRLQG